MPFRPEAIIVTTAEAAALLDITPTWLRRLVKDGHIVKGARDRLTLAAAVKGYLKFRREEDRRSSKSASASRVQDARAREIDLKIAEREGRLIDVVEHRDLFAECFGAIKSGLAGVPGRLTRDQALRRKIEMEIDDVLRKAADRFEQAAGNAAAPGDAVEANGGDDA